MGALEGGFGGWVVPQAHPNKWTCLPHTNTRTNTRTKKTPDRLEKNTEKHTNTRTHVHTQTHTHELFAPGTPPPGQADNPEFEAQSKIFQLYAGASAPVVVGFS